MKYEVGLQLISRKVEVHFDPSWTDEVEIHHKGFSPFKAKEVVIGESCGTRLALPEYMKPLKTERSRFLEGLNKSNITNRTKKDVAVVFRRTREVAQDV